MEKKTLYVTTFGARIHRQDGKVAVSVDKVIAGKWAPEEVDRALVFGSAQVTTQALALLLSHGVDVAFFSPSGEYRGHVSGPTSGSVLLRLAQHRRLHEEPFRLALAKSLVAEKIAAARELLLRQARNHPAKQPKLSETVARLGAALGRVEEAANADSLRGIEGAAAADYFGAWDNLVRAPFRFERRTRHPARNPVNALLNLGYTLLGNEIGGRLGAAGFDPRIGFFHGIRYGRSSLALDLLEAHRVDVVDRLTLALLNRRVFGEVDFIDRGGSSGVRLTPAALRRYIGAYEQHLGEQFSASTTPRRRLDDQVNALRRAVLSGDAGELRAKSPVTVAAQQASA